MSYHEEDDPYDDKYDEDFDPDAEADLYSPSSANQQPYSPASVSRSPRLELTPRKQDSFRRPEPLAQVGTPRSARTMSALGLATPRSTTSKQLPRTPLTAPKPQQPLSIGSPVATAVNASMASVGLPKRAPAKKVAASLLDVEGLDDGGASTTDANAQIAKLKQVNSKLRAQLMELNQILSEQLNQAGEKVIIKTKAKAAMPTKEAQNLQKEMEYYKRLCSDLKKQMSTAADSQRVVALENLAAERQKEIDRLKEENKGLVAVQREQSKALEVLGSSDDMQRALRTYQEDVRVLKERLRKSQDRLGEAEKTMKGQHETIVTLKERGKKMKEILELKGVNVDELPNVKQTQKMLEEKDKAIEDLTYKIDVLNKAIAAERKKMRSQITQAQIESSSLKAQLDTATAQLQDKEKELRLAMIQARAMPQMMAMATTAIAPSKPSAAAPTLRATGQKHATKAALVGSGAHLVDDQRPSTFHGGEVSEPANRAGSRIPQPGKPISKIPRSSSKPPHSVKINNFSLQQTEPNIIPVLSENPSPPSLSALPSPRAISPVVNKSSQMEARQSVVMASGPCSQPPDDYDNDFEPIDETPPPPPPREVEQQKERDPSPPPVVQSSATASFGGTRNNVQQQQPYSSAAPSFGAHWSAMQPSIVETSPPEPPPAPVVDPYDLGILPAERPPAVGGEEMATFKPGPFGNRKKKMPLVMPVAKS